MRAMVAAGVDIVEVGVPYSDPGMDGPTIQAAVDPAVRAGVAMRDVLRAVTAVADAGAAAVVMTYWNPVEHYGVTRFATDLADAGGSGAITPDLIPDEATPWIAASDAYGLDRVFLVAPSSTDARLATHGSGVPWLRLRRLHDGRHRSTGHGRDYGAHPGRAGTSRVAQVCGLRRASASRTGDRPRRSHSSPTASSSALRSYAACSTRRMPPASPRSPGSRPTWPTGYGSPAD